MQDKAITEFLENKKQDYLKKKVTAKTSDEDKQSLSAETNEKYLLENWLCSMKETADVFFTTHPSKITHSTPLSKQSKFKAKDLNIISTLDYIPDGYLKTGSVSVDMDFSGYPDNGTSTELYSFLKIELKDKRTVYEHFESDSAYIKKLVNSNKVDYQELKNSFLPTSKLTAVTSERIKQVYFPVGENYHLLSILTPSGIIFKLKQKINNIRFSEENKLIREELKKTSPKALSGKIEEIYDLTSIGYGGNNAQNISVLNNQNGGVSFLLSSLPPSLEKRQTQPPKKDFFEDCLWDDLFKRDFEQFHKVLSWRKNNQEVRDKRDDIVLNSITKLKRLVENIRDLNAGWSNSETYDDLAVWQKIWLDEYYADIRKEAKKNHDYLTKAQSYFANWFIGHYKHSTNNNKLLGDAEIEQIKKVLQEEQELLK